MTQPHKICPQLPPYSEQKRLSEKAPTAKAEVSYFKSAV